MDKFQDAMCPAQLEWKRCTESGLPFSVFLERSRWRLDAHSALNEANAEARHALHRPIAETVWSADRLQVSA